MTTPPRNLKTLADLVGVMAALRAPVTGCPWDLEQNFATIAPYTIEEAYEVADAIARSDLADLKDELGDLLLQVVYHARLAEEQGAFDVHDVVDAITRKMVRRHPHVFGDAEARSAGMAKGMWEKIKAEEKTEKIAARDRLAAATGNARSKSTATALLADVPAGMPALMRAVKLQDKAARVGFDWPSLGPVFDKLKEEMAELEEVALAPPSGANAAGGRFGSDTDAAGGRLPEGEQPAATQEELGDLLFVVANIARHLKIDPEAALRSANQKFTRRFAYVERRLAEQGRSPEQSTLAEMDRLWDEIRAADRKTR